MSKEKDLSILSGALRLWSAVTHGLGAVLGVLGTIILLYHTWTLGEFSKIGIFAVYGLSVISLYTASTLYHSVPGKESLRRALRKFDHCCIYFLIAGSYTPICLIALGNTVGYQLFGVIWFCAILGIVLTAVRLAIPHWVSSLIYLGMGWVAVFAIAPLMEVMSDMAMGLLALGGLFYTIGGVLYGLKWPLRNNPHFGCHEIFHLFILMGSVVHFVMMFYI